MSDVNAAAERADAILAGIDKTPVRYDDEWPGVRYERNERPLALLSDAYELASWFRKEHPADDGDAIDEACLRSVGFEPVLPAKWLFKKGRLLWSSYDGLSLTNDLDGDLPWIKTRGQLRQLLAAIG